MNHESGGQVKGPTVRLGTEGEQQGIGVDSDGCDNCHKINEIFVAGRRSRLGSVPFENRCDLVRDVIGDRVGPLGALRECGRVCANQWSHVVRLTGHPDIGAHKFHVEL